MERLVRGIPKDAQYIAKGADSTVYRHGDSVIKVYDELDYQTLCRYQEITNTLSVSLEEDPIRSTGIVGDEQWIAQFSVAKILEVVDRKPPLAISEYVSGQNASLFLRESLRVQQDSSQDVNPTTTGLYSPRDVIADRKLLRDFLDLTDPEPVLERLTGLVVIKNKPIISRLNMKIATDAESHVFSVVITDISNHIVELQ